jgi:hypothetical protein
MSTTHYVSQFDQIPVGGVFLHERYAPGLHVKNSTSTSRPYRGPEPDAIYEWGASLGQFTVVHQQDCDKGGRSTPCSCPT